MEDVADTGTAVVVGGQATDFEYQFGVTVGHHRDLRVGGFAVVDVPEAAADTEDGPGQAVLAQPPAGHVHLVDALVAQVAIAVVPDPMPVVVQPSPPQSRS